MGMYAILAEALRYPRPGQAEHLHRQLQEISTEPARRQALADFVACVEDISLAEWEELYTRTWDLDPLAAPYLGFQVWGDTYKRGNFMAQMNQVLRENEVDTEGELPDHLAPVLRYLDCLDRPPPTLLKLLDQAIEAMRGSLERSEADNPYLYLLKAIEEVKEASGR